jgi:hypothetical protein
VRRRPCLALPLSSSTSRILPLVAGLHGKTPEMSPLAPPTCPRQCFQPSGTCTKSWLCVICPVCAHRWHPQIIARTARCSFLPAQPRWTRSTHLTLCSRPLGICVCALFAMVLQLNHQFCTQLARTTADQTTITSLHTDSGVPGCPLLDFIIPVLCTL